MGDAASGEFVPRGAERFEIRDACPGDAPAIGEVQATTWRTTYPGLLPAAVIESQVPTRCVERWERCIDEIAAGGTRRRLLVAADGGGVFGFAFGGPVRGTLLPTAGELIAIYVLRDRQRGGAGGALLQGIRSHLGECGFASMGVWVLAGNPACRFYERMGGVRLPIMKRNGIPGVEMEEVAYAYGEGLDASPSGVPRGSAPDPAPPPGARKDRLKR